MGKEVYGQWCTSSYTAGGIYVKQKFLFEECPKQQCNELDNEAFKKMENIIHHIGLLLLIKGYLI